MKTKGKPIAVSAGVLTIAILSLAAWLSWPHLRFWYLFEPLGVNAQGYREYRHRQTGIVMVRLPGGTFWMGAQRTDPKGQNYDPEAKDDEGPVHEIQLSPFLIGKYEVTQGQWKGLMASNPSRFAGDDTRPVEEVLWDDIQKFEAKTGLALPTEAQWECACRATTTTPIAGTGKLDDMGWYDANGGDATHPVGQKAPNGFGLYDMHGNVWEYCEDVYDEGFTARPNRRVPIRFRWQVPRTGSSGAVAGSASPGAAAPRTAPGVLRQAAALVSAFASLTSRSRSPHCLC